MASAMGRHHLVGDVLGLLVEDDIAQRNAVDGTFERRDMRADVGHGLLLETGQIRVFLYLRIGDADQFEVGFDRLLRHQNEVVAFLRLRKTLPEAGTALRHRDFTVGGDAVEDMEGVGMARHLVDAVGIGRHARSRRSRRFLRPERRWGPSLRRRDCSPPGSGCSAGPAYRRRSSPRRAHRRQITKNI